ncbi:hypothetical protein QVD17_18870 [Tagetes erecta]|uniref:Uncharacterized protein n=1 Tax=Tagetes erecta TaxID=13708 RepID=A0AAD8KM00_TARER|nr:hypothetical protein QVD17_18870 [Tagetes erecta]
MNYSILPFTKSITTSPHVGGVVTSKNHHHHLLHMHPPPLHLTRNNTSDSTTNTPTNNGGSASSLPPSEDTDTVKIKFKRGARRKARRRQENGDVMMMEKKEVVKKDWESMTITEKALELYVGEKGLLFWINKFAYASIYIIIGAWILFRFVGPALNLYQLDAPPLSPTDVLKGSPK